jgi:hypothetical protein
MLSYSDDPGENARVSAAHDRMLEPPSGVLRCECEGVCEFCTLPKCNHSANYDACQCRFCECGARMTRIERETGDYCEKCFAQVNRERFGDQPYATFVGFFEQPDGLPPFPVYNIGGNHPKRNSTVGMDTLWENEIERPWTPSFKDWKKWPKDAA